MGSGRYRWLVLVVGVVAQASLSAFHQGLPAIGPELQRHFHVGLVETGALLSAVAAGITLTLAIWGSLADRFGERAVLAAGLSAAAVFLAAAGVAGSYAVMFACLVAAGMLGSCANAASGRAVMAWFESRERGMALGIRQMATPLGGAAAAATLPLLAFRFGLAGAFWGLAAACLGAALACGLALRRRGAVRRGGASRSPLRDRRIWRLATSGALIVAGQLSLITYLVLFLNQHRGLGLAAAALVLTACQLAGAGARVLAGIWSDRLGERIRPMRWLAVLGGGLLVATSLLVEAPLWVLVPVLVITTVVCMSTNGLAFTATGELAGADRAGVAMGFQNTWLFISGALGPILFGAVVTALNWSAGFLLVAGLAIGGWLLLAPLARQERAGWVAPAEAC